jgi:tRNA (guanine-N7-)-methyltransferase
MPASGRKSSLLPVLSAGELLQTIQGLAAGQRFEIEIGCGNGHFLAEYARRNPQVCVAGLELKANRCLKAQNKIDSHCLVNAWVVQTRAEEFLPALPPNRVHAYHLYFPDPWPKSRHRRRRFLRAENVRAMAATLAPGGLILFGTDFFDYYLQAKLLLALQPALELQPLYPPEEVFLSVFARRFRDIAKEIRFLAARKLPVGPLPGTCDPLPGTCGPAPSG